MIKQAMAVIASAALAAAPVILGAQTPSAPITTAPGKCDCPQGDSRGDLRNLAAFAPLGLLGALAAAGGTPALFGTKPVQSAPAQTVAATPSPASPGAPEVAITERARSTNPESPATGEAPAIGRGDLPKPVSPDSLRAGLRAPNTGTPLVSVFLLGTGLIAVGCVTVLRARS